MLVLTWIIWRCGCRFRLSEASTKTIMVPCEDLIKKIRRSNIMASDVSAAAAETGCDDFMEMSGATVPCFHELTIVLCLSWSSQCESTIEFFLFIRR